MNYQLPIQKPSPDKIPGVASLAPGLDLTSSEQAQPQEDLGQMGFSAFVDSQIGAGGFKASTKDGKSGFIIQSGPYKGQSKEQAMQALRAQYVAMPPEQKQQWEARGTGRDLSSQAPPAASPRQGKSPMNYGMGGAPSFSGLDWLRDNRKTGDELAQAESNVAWTGDRSRTPRINPFALGPKYDAQLKANFDGERDVQAMTPQQVANFERKNAKPAPPASPLTGIDPAQPKIPQLPAPQAETAQPPAPPLPISKPVWQPPQPMTPEGKLAEARSQNMANAAQPPALTTEESAALEELRRKARGRALR